MSSGRVITSHGPELSPLIGNAPSSVSTVPFAYSAGRKSVTPRKPAANLVSGSWNTCCGVPDCSIRPPFMIAIRSPMNRASSWSCVTNTTVTPASARIDFTSPLMRALRSASRFEKGSSSSITSGFGASARASATRCCSPPESS